MVKKVKTSQTQPLNTPGQSSLNPDLVLISETRIQKLSGLDTRQHRHGTAILRADFDGPRDVMETLRASGAQWTDEATESPRILTALGKR